MRTRTTLNVNQSENVTFYVERKANFGFVEADIREIILPVSGSIEISCDGKRRVIENGSIAFFAPNVKHRATLRAEDGEYVIIRMKEDYVKSIFELFDAESYTAFTEFGFIVKEITKVHHDDITYALQSVHISESNMRGILLKKLAYQIFMPLIPFKRYNGAMDVVQRALAVMNDAANISLRLPDVALKVGCSEEYLVRCFKKNGKETPNTIFKRIKLRYAKSVLTSSKISVSEVSALIGFRSVGHFNKLYFSEYGVCPGADKTR